MTYGAKLLNADRLRHSAFLLNLEGTFDNQEGMITNLVPRSHSVTGNVRSGKVRFRACSVPARPEIQAFLSVRMFVLSVVSLGDFAE